MYRHLSKLTSPRPVDEPSVRTSIALVFIVAMIAFYVWFIATHLQRLP